MLFKKKNNNINISASRKESIVEEYELHCKRSLYFIGISREHFSINSNTNLLDLHISDWVSNSNMYDVSICSKQTS